MHSRTFAICAFRGESFYWGMALSSMSSTKARISAATMGQRWAQQRARCSSGRARCSAAHWPMVCGDVRDFVIDALKKALD